jgi:hypothetical protein
VLTPSLPSCTRCIRRPSLAKALTLLVAPGLAAVAVLAYSPSAHAQGYYQGGGGTRTTYEYFYDDRRNTTGLELGADLEGAVPINIRNVNGNDVRGGGGFKVRVGETFRFRDLRVTPEIGYGFTHLFANDDNDEPAYDWNLHRAFAGVRFGFGRFIVPVVYGHVGYGWRATNDPIIPQASGLAYDAGVALDLHLIPHFGFGAHAEVAGIDSQPYTPQWIALGLHAELVF